MENREYKDMEFLMKELHSEWERTGKTKKKVKISVDADEKIQKAITEAARKTAKELANDELTFKQMMALTHENYIILRLGKKLKQAENHVRAGENGLEMTLELDKEEYRVCKEILDL